MDEKKSIRIENLAVNLIAATQPDWIKTNLGASHFGEGFMSRFIIVYADKPRFTRDVLKPDIEQIASRTAITEHLKKLSKLRGRVEFTDEAIEYRKSIIEPVEGEHKNIYNLRCNKSPFLIGYYERKLLAWFKTAMGFHFAESLDLTMGVKPLMQAYDMLTNRLEPHMHKAFSKIAANVNYDAQQIMLTMVRMTGAAGMAKTDLRIAANQHMDAKAYNEMLELWATTGSVKIEGQRFFAK